MCLLKHRVSQRILSFLLIFTLVLGVVPLSTAAAEGEGGEAIWNKDQNTAFITSKNAQWTDRDNYLAELTLTINGTQVLEPLDVVVVLDRSGSMDMSYIGNRKSKAFDWAHGYPTASCPCLNQDHFYLAPVVREIDGLDTDREYQFWRNFSNGGDRNITIKYYEDIPTSTGDTYTGWACDSIPPTYVGNYGTLTGDLLNLDAILIAPFNNRTFKDSATGAVVYYDMDQDQWYEYGYEIPEPESDADPSMVYDMGDGTLAVYKGDYDVWVAVDMAQETNLYYQFDDTSIHYIPYHFRMVDGEYQHISHWDSELLMGTWRHADEGAGCFDRWTEAKSAISIFTEQLLDTHPANNIALVPFSVRDTTMVQFLNGTAGSTYNHPLRDYIIDRIPGAFTDSATGVTIEDGNTLSGDYKSWVTWTDDAAKIDDMLPRLFTTGNTDYMYGLSMAYNLLYQRTQDAKESKRAVVLFISDGVPYSMGATTNVPGSGSVIASFYNPDLHITGLSNAIKSTASFVDDGGFWSATTERFQRHDVNPAYLLEGSTGAPGLGAQIVTVGYMIDGDGGAGQERLQKIASNPDCYIDIPATDEGSIEGHLAEQLLNSSIFPGGRESVLRDEISQYYYVPDDWDNPYDNVTVEGTQDEDQTVVWTIGDIFKYLRQENEPSITIPLVLREEYRDVTVVTYYPTNADPDPDLYDPEREPDGPDTGAKLIYKDPHDTWRYDTIGTPKLPVEPPPFLSKSVDYEEMDATANADGTSTTVITYLLTYNNTGSEPIEHVVITDSIPAGTAFRDFVGTPADSAVWSTVEDDDVVTGIQCYFPVVPAGASASVSFAVTVTDTRLVAQEHFVLVDNRALVYRDIDPETFPDDHTPFAPDDTDPDPSNEVTTKVHYYPYRVEYYRDSVSAGNLLGTEDGLTDFATGYRLTTGDVTDDLATGWIDLYRTDAGTGYEPGSVVGGYPIITVDIENNVVRVVYVTPTPEPEPDPDPDPEPEPEPELVSLYISKRLVDEDGNQVGDGKKFAVRLYDAGMNLIGQYSLSANEDGIVVPGLRSGATYYLQEELYDGFTILGYEIVGVGFVENSTAGLRIPAYGSALTLEVVVVNRVDDLLELTDTDIPLGEYPKPENPPLIDIPDETPPLAGISESEDESQPPAQPDEPIVTIPQTGDESLTPVWLSLFGLSALGLLLMTAVDHRKRAYRLRRTDLDE